MRVLNRPLRVLRAKTIEELHGTVHNDVLPNRDGRKEGRDPHDFLPCPLHVCDRYSRPWVYYSIIKNVFTRARSWLVARDDL